MKGFLTQSGYLMFLIFRISTYQPFCYKFYNINCVTLTCFLTQSVECELQIWTQNTSASHKVSSDDSLECLHIWLVAWIIQFQLSLMFPYRFTENKECAQNTCSITYGAEQLDSNSCQCRCPTARPTFSVSRRKCIDSLPGKLIPSSLPVYLYLLEFCCFTN